MAWFVCCGGRGCGARVGTGTGDSVCPSITRTIKRECGRQSDGGVGVWGARLPAKQRAPTPTPQSQFKTPRRGQQQQPAATAAARADHTEGSDNDNNKRQSVGFPQKVGGGPAACCLSPPPQHTAAHCGVQIQQLYSKLRPPPPPAAAPAKPASVCEWGGKCVDGRRGWWWSNGTHHTHTGACTQKQSAMSCTRLGDASSAAFTFGCKTAG